MESIISSRVTISFRQWLNMIAVKDQLGRQIILKKEPRRIISLVPSQTELLFDLGLDERVVGITKFCVHPKEWHQNKIKVGGTKKVNFKTIADLNPDLIIANKEENTPEIIDQLEKLCPVYISDVNSFDQAIEMIDSIGKLTGKSQKALALVNSIAKRFQHFKEVNQERKVVYFIWKDPYYVVGKHTFIHDMIQQIGYSNLEQRSRYPEWSPGMYQEADLVFLSSEPFPFNSNHKEVLHQYFPNTTISLVDGEMFSWYGSRMLLAADYFDQLIGDLADQ